MNRAAHRVTLNIVILGKYRLATDLYDQSRRTI